MSRAEFYKKVIVACVKVEPNPEHGQSAYRDSIELLLAQHVLHPTNKIKDARDVVLSHMNIGDPATMFA
jgi:hypothetical protein